MSGVDESYVEFLVSVPAPLRDFARQAPARLGLTECSDVSWGRFVTIPPNRDLVLYTAEVVHVSAVALDHYRVAHHLAGFHGIVSDRIADGQVAPDRRFLALRRRLLRAWEARLTLAVGSSARARKAIALALLDWRRGRAIERQALERGHFGRRYGEMVRLKLGWISATARCMLDRAGEYGRSAILQRVYHLFLVALQCRDDVVDRDEDRRLHGIDVPRALGVAPGAMIRAAALLVPEASALAAHGGFSRLSAWLGEFGKQIDGFIPGNHPLADQLHGMALADDILREDG
jgi:hypothetical protein